MIPRRRFLHLCAGAMLPACTRWTEKESVIAEESVGPESEPTTSRCDDSGVPVDGWVELPLSEYPELRIVGGFAYIEVPDRLVNVVVVHTEEDCYTALWRICTHGACAVDWNAENLQATCPCHGSIFEIDGAVREGPATTALRVFPVLRLGESLYLQR
ncbi:MAG TPA: Rieske 2Fe-2S domain-containing protein [Myxococcota bacterium]|nr:Rieske 2Fe-2S domain-containing protein [Myxococcota bacterium]